MSFEPSQCAELDAERRRANDGDASKDAASTEKCVR